MFRFPPFYPFPGLTAIEIAELSRIAGIFLIKNWFAVLCNCTSCTNALLANQLGFLLKTYEESAEVEPKKEDCQPPSFHQTKEVSLTHSAEQAFLQSDMTKEQKLKLVDGYRQFQESFQEFLKELRENNVSVVTEEVL